MKVRVYINSDPRSSHLFANIDKVIDGSDNASFDGSRKLVLMKKKESSKDSSVTSKDVLYDTIAVFNHWTFWRMLSEDTKECEKCGCSVIGNHKNSEGQILCTTCEEDAKRHQPDKDTKYK